MRTMIISTVLLALSLAGNLACNTEKKEASKEEKVSAVDEQKQEIPSVCIWDKAVVKTDALQKAKSLSTMALGEKVLILGEAKTDSADKNRKYFKIRLSDGKEGWVSEYVIAVDAKPAVAVERTPLYLRPDLLTVTDKAFAPLEFVAISNENKEWCEARGQENKKKGWIKMNSISMKDVDITVAVLGTKAMAEADNEKKKDKIEAILNNPTLGNSVFTQYLSDELERLWPSTPPEPAEVAEDSTGE